MTEQEAYAEAVAAFEKNDPEAGLKILEPFVAANPANYRFWHLRGLLLREVDRREEALKSLERAVALGPDAPGPAHALARTLHEAGLPSSQAYARALQLAGPDEDMICGLASTLLAEGQAGAAIAGLDRILAGSPHWARGHSLLSQLRWALGDRDDFARSFKDALEARPADTELRNRYVSALLDADLYDQALSAIGEGRAASGDSAAFDISEAIALDSIGRTKEAGALFAKLRGYSDAAVQLHYARHLIRRRLFSEAGEVIEPWLSTPSAADFWPYAEIVWRVCGDPRWKWLTGEGRFIGVYDIADRLPPLDELAETLRALHARSGQMLAQSVRGGTQTDGNLFHRVDPMIVAVREAILSTVAKHVAAFPERDPSHPLLAPIRTPIRFSGAWSVRLTGGGYHSNHIHSMGWISSALYIVLPDGRDDQEGALTIGEPPADLGLDLPPLQLIRPEPGRLTLFPSYMWHGTRPFGAGERMTIAFDVARIL
jgi:tetratricopeptide (TPR) repeat protein